MSRLLPRFCPDETAAERREALRKAEEAPARAEGAVRAADRWTMRGVPCVGGKDWPGSAIPGTQPEEEALRRLEAQGW